VSPFKEILEIVLVFQPLFVPFWFILTIWCMVLFIKMARRVKRIVDLLEDLNRTPAHTKHPEDDPAYRL